MPIIRPHGKIIMLQEKLLIRWKEGNAHENHKPVSKKLPLYLRRDFYRVRRFRSEERRVGKEC